METVLELKDIVKNYPGVKALKGVSLSFLKGEVHAIVGENGAGKSTLIKSIAGAITADSGELILSGTTYYKLTPRMAKDLGIEVIYQEFNLLESLSAAENIFLGERFGKLVSQKLIEDKSAQIFRQFNVDIDPATIVEKLTPAHMQIVEIAKAISKDVKILIMDEPTAPLTVSEVESLFNIIRSLKEKGITIIYISHRLDEIFTICDRVSVMRDGEYVTTKKVSATNRQELISLMVGREINKIYVKECFAQNETALEIQNFSGNGIENISFALRKGEILGFSGLVGAGRTELMRLVFGADKKKSGRIFKDGREITIRSPRQALTQGIGLIPEDRKQHGIFLDMSIAWNISISCIREISRRMVVDTRKERDLSLAYSKELKVKTPNLGQLVRNLSGGNQQKVVLAKILAVNTDIIIFDEPTRGIDIGAREEIYMLMVDLVRKGKSIIMISSDMEELLGMSDRILVISEGHLVGEVQKEDFSQELILELASSNIGGK